MQLTLTNEKLSDEQLIPLTMEIEFTIEPHNDREDSVMWSGKSYPNAGSGSDFGGIHTYEGKETIREIIDNEKGWLHRNYGRPIKEKITIIDKRKKNENTLL